MPRLALITEPRADRWEDEELPLILAALDGPGIAAEAVPWSTDADWSAFDLAVIRSPWDLYHHVDAFIAWTHAIERQTAVLNPAPVLRWTLDKRYLRTLAGAGVGSVPTEIVEPGETARLPQGEFVVKPVTSGGSMNTARYAPDEAQTAREHIARIHTRGMAAMVQPYLSRIDTTGERALVFFNGVFDHAIRKLAVLRPGEPHDAERESHPSPQPYTPTRAELDLAAAALATVPRGDELLYARIDIADLDDGTPAIMELELVEPWLFLAQSDGAADRYAAAIRSRLDRR